jgi:branched-chain amino acid transport system substrate-binding protein
MASELNARILGALKLYGKGTVRVDGRKIHDMHLFEVKKPSESNYFGDFLQTAVPNSGNRGFSTAERRRLSAGRG